MRDRTHLIVLNKIDCIDTDRLQEVMTMFTDRGMNVLAVSAKEKTGIDSLKEYLADILEEQRELAKK